MLTFARHAAGWLILLALCGVAVYVVVLPQLGRSVGSVAVEGLTGDPERGAYPARAKPKIIRFYWAGSRRVW